MTITTLTAKVGVATEVLLWIVALAMLVQNVALLRENRRLMEAAAPQITPGVQLRMLAGLTLDGEVQAVDLHTATSKLLVITFSPGCPACQANQERWTKLANTLKQSGVRVLWVSRDPVEITREYCLKHGIPLADVIADPPFRTYVQLGLARVPNTVLVRAGGVVEKVWAGRMDPAGWNAMFAHFDERQDAFPAARSAVDVTTTGCGPGTADASVKDCR